MGKKNFLKSSLTIAAAATVMSTLAPMSTVKAATTPQPTLTYSAHVAKYAWMGAVTATGDTNTPFAGTVQESKLADAFKINLEGIEGVELEYSVHNRTIGWSDWMKEGEVAGYVQPDDKFGSKDIKDWKQAEAIKIRVSKGLDKLKAAGYEIRYRVHLGYDGWEKEWTVADDSTVVINQRTTNSQTGKDANGNKVIAGSVGWSRRIEALQVMLVKTKPEVQNKFDFTVNSNNIINDTNATKSTVTISTSDEVNVTEDTKFDLYYVNSKGEDVELEDATGLKIDAFSNKEINKEIDLSSILNNVTVDTEQKITLKLKRTLPKPEEVVGTAEVTVNRIHPEVARISASREGTQGAGLKFEAKDGSDISKVYYEISTSATKSITDVKDFIDLNKNTAVKSMTVENNKFDKKLDWTDLSNTKVYYVHFVVENAAGNLSDEQAKHVYTAVVPKDNATQETKVTNVKISDDLKVTFTEPSTKPAAGYTIIIYNAEGKVVAEVPVTKGEGTTGKDISSNIPEDGKYTITVVSKGNSNGATKSSDETEPVEFEVSQLSEVTGLHFETDETGKTILKWNEYADKENEAFTGYTINIYKYDPTTKSYETATTSSKSDVNKEDTSIELTKVVSSRGTFTAADNTRYKAEIIANGSGKVVSSEATPTEKDYCKITIAMTATAVTDTEIDLTMNTPAQISTINTLGDKVTYDVEVWTYEKSDHEDSHWKYSKTIENVEFKDGKTVVLDNLEPNTTDGYKFILVAHVDGNMAEGKTAQTAATKTKITLPSLNGKVVKKTGVTKAENTAGGFVYAITTSSREKLYIDGVEIDLDKATDYYDPNKLLDTTKANGFAIKLVNSLEDGDKIVSVTEEKITVESKESATTKARNIEAGKRILEIHGNKWLQEVKADKTKVKEVILTGEITDENPLFKIDTSSDAPIKLANGVKVENDANKFTATVLANATATINGINISSSGDLKFEEENNSDTGHALKISPAGEQTINIVNNSGKTLNVTFMNGATAGQTQIGAIEIKSDADVTVKAGSTKDKGNMAADITVETTNGSINIQDKGLKGEKTIVVSNDGKVSKTITAYTVKTAPIKLENIEIKEYTYESLKALRDGTDDTTTKIGGDNGIAKSVIKSLSDEQLRQLSDYFSAFGEALRNKGVLVSNTRANQDTVTITLPANEDVTISAATIEGLK